ncbi:hypothetical protein AB0O18_34000 [Streptomyces sp. NPDC093224]|uniref:hypothetical protein n=1 Tax=Streptomyces sp. NPDC093224 TaxID=3155198 RepID=UPI0034387D78
MVTTAPTCTFRRRTANHARARQAGIQAMRSGVFQRVHFDTPPNTAATAQVLIGPEIVYHQRFRSTDFRLLRAAFSHEALHQDPQVKDNGELIATTLHIAHYGQLFLK